MKEVGLAVVTYKDNFGSALQTYATQRVIEKLGYRTGIFDISNIHRAIKLRKVKYYAGRIFQPDELRYLLDMIKSHTGKNARSNDYANNMKIRHALNESFSQEHLKFMDRKNSWDEISEQSRTCDHVIVGSDQLWRPSNIAGGYFTLEFVPDQVCKTAYSTSFGVSSVPTGQRKHAQRFLNRIEYISVREDTGRAIVKELTGRDVPVVCDPAMLLNAQDWMSIQREEPMTEGKYILCYFLGDNPGHRAFAKRLKGATGYRIIGLLHGATYIPADDVFADEAPYDIGPSEFVNLIRNAAFICTDSFHGTVFSILNGKRFFTFRRFDDTSGFSTNDRLHTLLNWTGLAGRMLYGTENAEDCVDLKIEYADVFKRIEEKREGSLKYLTDSLRRE